MVPQRALGATGLTIPAMGFGVSGPLGAPITSGKLTKRLVDLCLEGGAGLFDTAPFYGAAEQRLGSALDGVARDRYTLISKVGTRRGAGGWIKDFTASSIQLSLDNSLRSLRTDHIDILLLHGPPIGGPQQDAIAVLEDAKKAGKIRVVGICGRGHEIETALAHPTIEVIQAPVWVGGWAQRAAEAGRGFLAIEVLRAGVDGFRAPRGAVDLWYMARLLHHGGVGALLRQAPGRQQAARTLLRKAMSRTGVSAAIITTARPAHLSANLRAATETLDGAAGAP
jgi:aryl-alcohol dehydrogenase-like predicted oxidoreductase